MENFSQKDIDRASLDQKINSKLESIQNDVQDIKSKLEKNYVTKEELNVFKAEIQPYVSAVKGLLALIVTSVIVALLAIIIKK